ncbi:hypothetical protein ACOMHN_032231 [Nucella lapillus]
MKSGRYQTHSSGWKLLHQCQAADRDRRTAVAGNSINAKLQTGIVTQQWLETPSSMPSCRQGSSHSSGWKLLHQCQAADKDRHTAVAENSFINAKLQTRIVTQQWLKTPSSMPSCRQGSSHSNGWKLLHQCQAADRDRHTAVAGNSIINAKLQTGIVTQQWLETPSMPSCRQGSTHSSG